MTQNIYKIEFGQFFLAPKYGVYIEILLYNYAVNKGFCWV